MRQGTVAFVLIVGLAACSMEPTASRSASPGSSDHVAGSAAATLTPTATPSQSLDGSPVSDLRPDTMARVITDDLAVRSLPEISDQSTIDPVYLQNGQLLFVLDGPTSADGYDWYQVAPFDACPSCNDTPMPQTPLFGWVAAGDPSGGAWIAPYAEPCAGLGVDPVNWRPGPMALACFGARTLTVEGAFAGCGGLVPGFAEPTWLAETGCEITPAGFDPTEGGGIGPGNVGFRIPPGVAMPNVEPGAKLQVVGHLDDPASAECRQTDLGRSQVGPIPPEVVILRCRGQFVATEIRVAD